MLNFKLQTKGNDWEERQKQSHRELVFGANRYGALLSKSPMNSSAKV